MNIIIVGSNPIAAGLAEHLSGEDYNITLIGRYAEFIRSVQHNMDIRTIVGRGCHPNILRQAGAKDADIIIAVTDNDEANIVTCEVANGMFGIPTKIARLRSSEYLDQPELFGSKQFSIDVIISPEQLVTDAIHQLVQHPGALQVLDFASGKLELVAIRPERNSPLVGKTISVTLERLAHIDSKIIAIYRNEQSIPISNDTKIQIDDEVFFIAPSGYIQDIVQALNRVDDNYENIIIAGGGNIGFRLAKALEQHYNVKLIEHSPAQTQRIAVDLHNTTVLLGEAADKQLLYNENIETTDVFVAVTNDDEANIMSCIQAKRLGARKTIALVGRKDYVDLIDGAAIDIAISPQLITISGILTHVRQGDIAKVHSLRRGAAEAIELIAHGDQHTSQVVGRPIKDINLPPATHIGAIVRKNKTIIPDQRTIIESEDHIVIFVVDKKYIHQVEKLFQVNVAFF